MRTVLATAPVSAFTFTGAAPAAAADFSLTLRKGLACEVTLLFEATGGKPVTREFFDWHEGRG